MSSTHNNNPHTMYFLMPGARGKHRYWAGRLAIEVNTIISVLSPSQQINLPCLITESCLICSVCRTDLRRQADLIFYLPKASRIAVISNESQ